MSYFNEPYYETTKQSRSLATPQLVPLYKVAYSNILNNNRNKCIT